MMIDEVYLPGVYTYTHFEELEFVMVTPLTSPEAPGAIFALFAGLTTVVIKEVSGAR